MGHSVNGRNLCGIIAGYMVLKQILNLILGFGLANIFGLVLACVLGYLLISSKKFMNIVTAVFLVVTVLLNIKGNIQGLGFNKNLIYLAEAVIDVICAFQLVANKDIREFFNHG